MRPQTGSASEPAKASLPPSKTTVPAETSAKVSKALPPQPANANRGVSMLVQAATPSPGPAPLLPKQPSTARPILPASPRFQKSIPVPARTALTPLSTSAKSGKTPFKPAAPSPFPVFAGRAVTSSPLTALTLKGSGKPASKGTGAFPNLFQQPSRTSGGSTRSAASPGLGIATLQAGVQSSFPTQSSNPAGLSQAPCISKTAEMTGAAPSAGANPQKPVTQTASMHPSVSPVPGQGVHAIRDHRMTGSPCINQQAAQPPQLSLQGNTPMAPKIQSQAGRRPGGPTADTVLEEEIHGRHADPKPWTSTSLAAGLMGNMRNLEEVIFHAQNVVWTAT
ncbi:hypothetical protein ABBQ32_001218 [Trebouxia sp. C0010 RCD-2024]